MVCAPLERYVCALRATINCRARRVFSSLRGASRARHVTASSRNRMTSLLSCPSSLSLICVFVLSLCRGLLYFVFCYGLTLFFICCAVDRTIIGVASLPVPLLVKVPTYLYDNQLRFYSPSQPSGGRLPASEGPMNQSDIRIYVCTRWCSPNLKLCGPGIPKYKNRLH